MLTFLTRMWRMCTSLGLRVKFKILFISDDTGRLDWSRCYTVTGNMMMAVGEINTAIILICHSFLFNMSKQFLAPGGLSAVCVLASCNYPTLGPQGSLIWDPQGLISSKCFKVDEKSPTCNIPRFISGKYPVWDRIWAGSWCHLIAPYCHR